MCLRLCLCECVVEFWLAGGDNTAAGACRRVISCHMAPDAVGFRHFRPDHFSCPPAAAQAKSSRPRATRDSQPRGTCSRRAAGSQVGGGKNIMTASGFIISRLVCLSVCLFVRLPDCPPVWPRFEGEPRDVAAADEFCATHVTNKQRICINRPFGAWSDGSRSQLDHSSADKSHSSSADLSVWRREARQGEARCRPDCSAHDKTRRQTTEGDGGIPRVHLPETKRVSRATISQSFPPTALSSARLASDYARSSRAESAVASR